MIDLHAYLKRIGFEGPRRPDLDTLNRIHRAHALAIPYENLDVQLKRPMTIDPYAAFDKLVHRNRGGWCYEMNGTLGLVLEAIGFNVARLSANGSTEDSHLFLTVDLNGHTYICDVGFADGPIQPYPMKEGAFAQDGFEYRLEREANGRWRLHNHRFGMTPGFLAAGPNEDGMEKTCQWLQSSPDSPFVQHVTVCKRTESGFSSLVDRMLRHIIPSGVTRKVIDTADEYVEVLHTHFGLTMPEVATLWPAVCERHEIYLRESAARKAAKQSA